MYKGNADKVQWAGDFNEWNPETTGYSGTDLGNGLWLLKQSYPKDARLDYKIVLNGSNWIMDPANSYIQYSGFGPNSELRMPDWIYPQETKLAEGVTRGSLSSNIVIESIPSNLGYKVQYRVYTPYNYDNLSDLPVVFVADGQEYADDRLGSMLIVADNLIFQQKINPIIIVFIDARNPDNLSQNRRMAEYAGNIKYANFLADELVPVIYSAYKTKASSDMRCIMGTSMGGWNAAYVGLKRFDKFGLLAIHSPAFDNQLISLYGQSEKLPLKIFMSSGVINDTQIRARQLQGILIDKGYPLLYVEVNQGHSWGNWRSLIDDPLQYFFR
jgi:enterochelin esterase family protein